MALSPLIPARFDLRPRVFRACSDEIQQLGEYRTGAQKALFEPNRSIKVKLNDDFGGAPARVASVGDGDVWGGHREQAGRSIAFGRALDDGA
jgi:hypothetical protein